MTTHAKVYVAVIASFSEEGNLYPRKLRWKDGREYLIEKYWMSDRLLPRRLAGKETGIQYRSMDIPAICSSNEVQISAEQT